MRPGNYAVQAETYDRTRGASPSLVRAIGKHLGEGGGRALADIAGGTGNYAQVFAARGFRVTVVDAEPAMLAHAARKLGPSRCVVGDVHRLPLRDGAVDAAMIVVAAHLFEDRQAAFSEARRVVRAGPVVVVAYTLENLSSLFVNEYFDWDWPEQEGPRMDRAGLEETLRAAGFAAVRSETFVYADTVGGSLVALHTDPFALAGEAYLRNTSFWHRLPEEARRRGLEALHADLRSGVLAKRVEESMRRAAVTGHGTVFVASP